MELRHLRTFEAVLRHGTVTDAAVALRRAPSSVSAQIRALEASLGVTLFTRTPAGMYLTDAGKRTHDWSQRLLDQADQARREITLQPQVPRLGALETIAATHAPRVLATLAERHLDLDVDVLPSVSRDDLLADLVTGNLDAALLLDTGDALGDLGFPPPAEPLTFLDVDTVPLALVAAPDHHLSRRTNLVVDDLANERLLVNVPNCSFRIAADKLLGPTPERIQTTGVPLMRGWAEQGLGIALLPEFAVTAGLSAGTLIALDFPTPDLNLRLVWHRDHEALPGVREMLYAAAAETA